jgi:hypothetical protein
MGMFDHAKYSRPVIRGMPDELLQDVSKKNILEQYENCIACHHSYSSHHERSGHHLIHWLRIREEVRTLLNGPEETTTSRKRSHENVNANNEDEEGATGSGNNKVCSFFHKTCKYSYLQQSDH